jgi:hypothetical protein
MRKKWIFVAPALLVGIVLFIFLGGEVVMLLWNWLLPPLFGWRALTFWQALGMLALCRILFGGVGARGPSRSEARRRIADRALDRMVERWDVMSPDERERFRQRIRWDDFPPPTI